MKVQAALFGEPLDAGDAAGLALSLRDAARSLGYATLALRGGEPARAQILVCNALRALVVAESALPIGAAQKR